MADKGNIRAKLDSEILDVAFSYEDEEVFIMPRGSKIYDVWYGTGENEVKKTYTSLEDLMTDKFYNGKSLEEIADRIKVKYY
ncbi:MAG: hypothetical protein E7203_07345 [Selenomonas ruminantium]|uniref:Uncharacterized protein n=1 Tax=Selenomonas ruminantium TaxID=971 RepID=A0A927WM31_SELRU|nr:hypothetical protein [Selenomonas ruminantium]MBE6085263.1 hypothetical protein [Selenomonas ruminantium]